MANQRMIFDGFWLPAGLREKALAGATWETHWLEGGAIRPDPADRLEPSPGAVGIRWPRLSPEQWRALAAGLREGRTVGGREVVERWQTVLSAARTRLAQEAATTIPTLAAATGYSPSMLLSALMAGDLVSAHLFASALQFEPTWSVARRWQRMPGLAGQARFFPDALRSLRGRAVSFLSGIFDPGRREAGRRGARLCRAAPAVDLALGYAAGNVPGTALLIALLGGLANYGFGDDVPSPAVLVRNSRHEPLFAPWVLSAVEALDPALVAGLAVMIWDYEDGGIQREVMAHAGLMIAAAGDDAIAALDAQRAAYAPGLRFHRHGHKVSFAVIATDYSPRPGLRTSIPLLAALDSSLWDQNGCLSARVHFVEGDADGYAEDLSGAMRSLASAVPRGTTPRRFIHRAFDVYKALEDAAPALCRVRSTYDDDFALIVDRRPWDADAFGRAVNACMGRVIIVRPVDDVLEVPRFLRWLPPRNLQSCSVVIDDRRLPAFAEEAGACGVTAIRSLGRAAFPQLAYSWDGLLPLDVAYTRPPGHFTTIEFDDLAGELAESAARWDL